jgi:hypothetical protein
MEWEKARGKGTPPQCVVRILSPFAQRDPAVAKARKTGAEGCPLTGSWVPWSSKVINRQARSFWSPRGIGAHLGIAKATRIKVLQLLEQRNARALRVGNKPGSDLFPEALERIWPAAPVMGSPTLCILCVPPFRQGERLGLDLCIW